MNFSVLDLKPYFIQSKEPLMRYFQFLDNLNQPQICGLDILLEDTQLHILLAQPQCTDIYIQGFLEKIAHTLCLLLHIDQTIDDPNKITWYTLWRPLGEFPSSDETMELLEMELEWQENYSISRSLKKIPLDRSPFDFSRFLKARSSFSASRKTAIGAEGKAT